MTIPRDRENVRTAVLAASVAAGMVGLAYASVPLYALFCQTTGFNGTTQRAQVAPQTTSKRSVKVRFDANTAATLGWTFNPEQLEMEVRLGEQAMANYRATNTTSHTATGTASFNVTPVSAGAYFNKIQCFCFTEQTLAAGESVTLPVVFFVDPAIVDDPDANSIDTITLSYTFYPVETPKAVSALTPPSRTRTN